MNATRLGGRSTMQQILDKDALSHVTTDVESQSGEVPASQLHDADSCGGLRL